jgi:hypothetical protein
MKSQRTFTFIAGVFFAVGFAASQASAGAPSTECDFTIEVNALRAGARTIAWGPNQATSVTTKARILKGTALRGTTIATTLEIQAIDGTDVISTNTTGPITLGVGKGGKGAKLSMAISRCSSGFINFVATFFGTDEFGVTCEGVRELRKNCK